MLILRLISGVLVLGVVVSPALAQTPVPPPAPAVDSSKVSTDEDDYQEAIVLRNKGDLDGALAKASAAYQQNPSDVRMLILRGDLYAKKKTWNEAAHDFSEALKMDPQNALARFDQAEIKLMQKQYETARPGFLALVKDDELGDLAAYKVFLCDLYGGNHAAAQKELDAFDKVDTRASYYYGNAAWLLYLGRSEDARSWLDSALRIYSPAKNYNYRSTLKELGYLPK